MWKKLFSRKWFTWIASGIGIASSGANPTVVVIGEAAVAIGYLIANAIAKINKKEE